MRVTLRSRPRSEETALAHGFVTPIAYKMHMSGVSGDIRTTEHGVPDYGFCDPSSHYNAFIHIRKPAGKRQRLTKTKAVEMRNKTYSSQSSSLYSSKNSSLIFVNSSPVASSLQLRIVTG
jgi:hypothetical protein